ncbi:MAG: TIGR00282 family metallophosphoesterase [Myxococcales bacterium]|nr:TIGR00282 family metallophosphoesterase [Myxococcales bacterium]
MRVLCIGDIFGKPGRDIVKRRLPELVEREALDLVIANGENAAGGVGITSDLAKELLATDIAMITGGNHSWRHREVLPYYDKEPRLLRPLNFPDAPGHGYGLCETRGGVKVGVINVMGRVYMEPLPSPFAAVDGAIEALSGETKIIIVDLHAEATSEKRAMGWYLDGRVSALFGTHTHVPTADEEILPAGTGYITDIGMTGPYNSVIGMKKEPVLERFLTLRPSAFAVGKGDVRLCGVIFDIDPESGKTVAIERVDVREGDAA